jgi:hypothetical protein
VAVSVRFFLAALAAVGVLARRGSAQATAGVTAPVGVWRGVSTCLVRSSPCHDEIVVYRIARATGSDSISLSARLARASDALREADDTHR